MANTIKILLCVSLLVVCGETNKVVFAQSLPEPKAACAYCGTPLPNGVHSKNCRYYTAPNSRGSNASSTRPDINAMVTEAILKSMLTSLFTPPNNANSTNQQDVLAAQLKASELAARQMVEYQKARDAAFMAEHMKTKKAFKSADGEPGMAFKELSDSALAFKSADENLEGLAAEARKPFDTAADITTSAPDAVGQATPFFGDTMAIENLQLLVNPENDARVVDLSNATTFVAENLKDEAADPGINEHSQADETHKKANDVSAECTVLMGKLDAFIAQRKKFQKTIDLAQQQLVTWQDANRNALWNAARDGLEYFSGELLETLSQRGKAADRLHRIYLKNMEKMTREGIDAADIGARIERLKILSSTGKISELSAHINDWQGFIKDGMSALISQLTSSNQEIKEMLADPRLQKYFSTDAPELNFLLDISKLAAANNMFGKWVLRKLPIIGAIEISVKQSYNALDWLLSFNRIVEANKVNGKVLDAAKKIQMNIDDTRQALKKCPIS